MFPAVCCLIALLFFLVFHSTAAYNIIVVMHDAKNNFQIVLLHTSDRSFSND